MLTALSVVILWLGGLLNVLDLTTAVIASFAVVFVHIEMRAPWSFGVWAATSFLSILLTQNSASLYYAVFCGLYAILKAYMERLPRILQWIVKIFTFNLLFTGIFLLAKYVFLLPDFDETGIMLAVLYVLGNLAFICYDIAMTVCINIYVMRIRRRIVKYLK